MSTAGTQLPFGVAGGRELHRYRSLGVDLTSNVPLPGLLPCRATDPPDVRVELVADLEGRRNLGPGARTVWRTHPVSDEAGQPLLQVERAVSGDWFHLRYCDAEGQVTAAANPNGAAANIAGIVNEAGNVFGLMPHPEHAVEALVGGTDGSVVLGSLLDAVRVAS